MTIVLTWHGVWSVARWFLVFGAGAFVGAAWAGSAVNSAFARVMW